MNLLALAGLALVGWIIGVVLTVAFVHGGTTGARNSGDDIYGHHDWPHDHA